jgi:hypothetical protein
MKHTTTDKLIRSDSESVFVVRVDHGQVIAECINAGEEFSPSFTACEMFAEALVVAGKAHLATDPWPRSSVEQLREKDYGCARHATPADCEFFGCGARRIAPPISRHKATELEQRLERLEAACAGIVRDHEFRRVIAHHGRAPNGDC